MQTKQRKSSQVRTSADHVTAVSTSLPSSSSSATHGHSGEYFYTSSNTTTTGTLTSLPGSILPTDRSRRRRRPGGGRRRPFTTDPQHDIRNSPAFIWFSWGLALFMAVTFATLAARATGRRRPSSGRQTAHTVDSLFQLQSLPAPVCHPLTTTTTSTSSASTLTQQRKQQHHPTHHQVHTTESAVSFTLVSQCSMDRLWMMEHHCARWPSDQPISLAVLIDHEESTNADADHVAQPDAALTMAPAKPNIKPKYHQQASQQAVLQLLVQQYGCNREQLTVQTLAGYSQIDYPVNLLRNMALAAVRTTHVVYVDMDFWPSLDLYEVLHRQASILAADPRTALVIPAFQLFRQCLEWRDCRSENLAAMPHNRQELFDLMTERKAAPFDPTNAGGHGSTRYNDWIDQTPDQVLPINCVKSNRYEPYLVFRYCRDLPPFQLAFTGYGKNKMTWVMHLRRAGYQFWQVSAFVVHYPHLDSPSRMKWNGGEGGVQLARPQDQEVQWLDYKRGQIDQTFIQFREWLHQAVPDQTRVPLCEDAVDDDAKLWIPRRNRRHDNTPEPTKE